MSKKVTQPDVDAAVDAAKEHAADATDAAEDAQNAV